MEYYKNINIALFVFISVVADLILIEFNEYFQIGFIIALIVFPFLVNNRKLLLYFFIVLMLTVVGELGAELRTTINIICFLGMSFLFFKDYGLDFKRYPRIPREMLFFFSLLYFSMIISSIFSKYMITGFLQIFYISLLFYLIYMFYSQIRSTEEIKYYLLGIITASLAMALSSLKNLLLAGFNFGELGNNHHFRTSGIFSNVNASAGYIAVALPVLLISLFYYKERKQFFILWGLIIIEIMGVITLASRGGMLAIVCSTILMLFILNRKLLFVLTIIVIPTLVLILISPLGNMFEFFFRLQEGLANRDELWKLTSEMIKHNFIFGVGPGSWGKEMFNYFPVMLDSYAGKIFINLYNVTNGANNSHNFYFALFSEMGIFGLLTAIAFPVVFFKLCYQGINKYINISNGIYLVIIGATAVGFGMFIRGFIEGISLITFGQLSVDIPIWLIVAIVAFLNQNYQELSGLIPRNKENNL